MADALQTVNVLLLGAGEINFGSTEGPWNHTLRLERICGSRLNIVGIVDPDTTKAKQQIDSKLDLSISGYSNCKIWASAAEAAVELASTTLELGIIGVPPHLRGSSHAPADLDMQLMRLFPQVKKWLVEKPISALPYAAAAGQVEVLEAYGKSGAVVGVGYHFAASKAVLHLQSIIKGKNLCVMATQARYNMAYVYARKSAWWNQDISCGPVVEQATHLANLSLLFGGKPILGSVRAHTVLHSAAPGHLSQLLIDESGIPEASRVPRFTSAIWRYQSGAVGSLSHSIALHGTTYNVEFEVIADGHIFKLCDLYTDTPKLVTLQDGNHVPEVTSFENDDCYVTQIKALLAGTPTCTYQQALDTYALTWAIRLAAEAEQKLDAF